MRRFRRPRPQSSTASHLPPRTTGALLGGPTNVEALPRRAPGRLLPEGDWKQIPSSIAPSSCGVPFTLESAWFICLTSPREPTTDRMCLTLPPPLRRRGRLALPLRPAATVITRSVDGDSRFDPRLRSAPIPPFSQIRCPSGARIGETFSQSWAGEGDGKAPGGAAGF
jgi:hypothetical protein